MKSAALVFCTMTITVHSEIFQEIFVKPGLSQETVVVTDQLQIPFTSNRLCYLFHSSVMFELLTIFWVSVYLQVQAFVPHAIALDVMNGRIELQVDGFHFTL